MQATDIIIHFTEDLDKQQRNEIEQQLREIDGVIAPRFNKEHLLVIYYNLNKTTSLFLNDFLKSIGYQTKLVGL